MSLDDTGLSLWEKKRPPLAMLVAAKVTEMLGAHLPAETQAPFLALSEALCGWWPARKPNGKVIYENEYAACLDAAGDDPKLAPILGGANMQMAGLLNAASRCFPSDAYDGLDEKDFIALLRGGAKVGRLPVTQLDARLKYLLENIREPWPKLVERAGRMRWQRGNAWGKLDKRLRGLASLADLGGTSSWHDVGGQRALRIELGGTKRIAMLSAEELETLKKVIPSSVPADAP